MKIPGLLLPILDKTNDSIESSKEKEITLADGAAVYHGGIKDGYLESDDAKFVWSQTGHTYQGQVKYNRPHGAGTFKWYSSVH